LSNGTITDLLYIRFYIDEIGSTKQELAALKGFLEGSEEKSAALEEEIKKYVTRYCVCVCVCACVC